MTLTVEEMRELAKQTLDALEELMDEEFARVVIVVVEDEEEIETA